MNETAQDIQKVEGRGIAPDIQPANILEYAIQKNLTPEQVEKFWEIQEKIDTSNAKKAYVTAMSAFKANPPRITKDRHVEYKTTKGVTSYDHASLANITETISKGLGAEGLTASWKTAQREVLVEVVCTITHCMGHSESTALKASPDQSGGKNNIQAIGSTISYLQRYTLLSLTGLATHEMDNDGRGNIAGEPAELITEEQLIDLQSLCEGHGFPADKTLQKLAALWKLSKIEDMHQTWYEKAVEKINAKAKQ